MSCTITSKVGVEYHSRGGSMTDSTTDGRTLRLPEVAFRLGVSVATVRRLIDSRGLPARRVGRQIRISLHEFEDWYSRQGLQAVDS